MPQSTEDEVTLLSAAKELLEGIPPEEQSMEYKQMIQWIQEFLERNCDHELIEDYIDLDLDRSQQIVYCKKCHLTLSENPRR